MTVVVKGNRITVIRINAGSRDNRSAKVTTDVIKNSFGIATVGLGINIEAIGMIFITFGLYFFEWGSKLMLHLVEQSGTERISEKSIVEVRNMPPLPKIAVTTFGNEAVNVRIPFEIPAKGMKNHDESRDKVLRLVELGKHTQNNTGNSMKKTMKQGAIFREERAKILINGKNTMAMSNVNEFKSHGSSTFHRVLITTGGTKTAVTAERDKLEIAAMLTAIHGTAEGGVTTMDHFVHVFNNGITWM